MSCETTQATTRNTNCVADTVKFINRLQQAVVPTEIGCSRCNTPILGETSKANTRPFILYLPNGRAFQLATFTDSSMPTIPVFRVESINGNCATLRALAPAGAVNFGDNGMCDCDQQFVPTRTCVNVDLDSFIAIQCLDDVFLKLELCDCI